jgi:hypothetical protein
VREFCDRHVIGPRRRLVDQSIERLMVNVAFGASARQHLAALVGNGNG